MQSSLFKFQSAAALAGGALAAANGHLPCSAESFSALVAGHSDASVNFVKPIPWNGTFSHNEPDTMYPANATQLPALCAVGIHVTSSASSSYNFGLFLPEKIWNHRFMATGNGGYGGGINWLDMGIFSQYGFATMSTDTGHLSQASDASWGLNAPESLIDWGYRAMHGSVVIAKEIIDAYYTSSDGIKYSYYASCSTGGRQGLKEIQNHPESFDGISIGAPAWWNTHLASARLWQGLYNAPASDPKHIDPSFFPAIVAEMVKQCDPQDGLRDGIISDPFSCNFDLEALLCLPQSDPGVCLTAAQIEMVAKFYSDWVDEGQTLVFPGVSLGTNPSYLMSEVSARGYGFYRYWIYNDTTWDYTGFSYQDVKVADQIDPGDATADNFDLSPYMQRGGKLLMYHGSADEKIPTKSSTHFYRQVQKTLAPRGIALDDFFRYFMVPGMEHCAASTVAPWYIAGGLQAVDGATHSVPGFEDANHDVVLALMRWVEQGIAPDRIIATKFKGDDSRDGVQSQRPLCVYPKQAKYRGGDPDVEASWECKELY